MRFSGLVFSFICAFCTIAAAETDFIPHVGLFTGIYRTEPVIFRTKSGPITFEDLKFKIDKKGLVDGETLRKTPFGGEGIRINFKGKLFRTRPAENEARGIEGIVSTKFSDGTELSGTCRSDEFGLSGSCRMTLKYRSLSSDLTFTRSYD